jgi:hypothetical protein
LHDNIFNFRDPAKKTPRGLPFICNLEKAEKGKNSFSICHFHSLKMSLKENKLFSRGVPWERPRMITRKKNDASLQSHGGTKKESRA